MTKNSRETLGTVVERGMLMRCPRCGEGKLFKSYLKQVDTCAACGEKLGHIRADDGPSWLTILIVGHILAPLLLIVSWRSWPEWVAMAVWVGAALILTFALLPRAKGIFIGIIWRAGCVGSET